MRADSKILTLAEIEKQFDSEWVLVGNPKTGENLEVNGGEVLSHSLDRDQVYRDAIRLKPRNFAITYVGRMPKDAAIVL